MFEIIRGDRLRTTYEHEILISYVILIPSAESLEDAQISDNHLSNYLRIKVDGNLFQLNSRFVYGVWKIQNDLLGCIIRSIMIVTGESWRRFIGNTVFPLLSEL